MGTSSSSLDEVVFIIAETLSIQDRASSLNGTTPLFGSMPELDSLAVVELITILEERFAFYLDDDELSGDVFETIGTLADFVDKKRNPPT